MSTWLIQISFGPVQGFIAAARRTRDLWGGSRILSEIARAGGKSLVNNGVKLIYPAPSRVTHNQDKSNLSNVLLASATCETAEQAKAIAEQALQAGKDRLKALADDARCKFNGLDLECWDAQIDDVLETFAAWTKVESTGSDSYVIALGKLKSALAARKNTRDFNPMQGKAGKPKSSLDGLRETVLPEKLPLTMRRKLGLNEGEQLDALGVVKRQVGKSTDFTALTRLAAHSWIQMLSDTQRNELCQTYEPLVSQDLATRSDGNAGLYKDFPYDASLLYPDRLQKELTIAKADNDDKAQTQLKKLHDQLHRLYKQYGHPCPYVAILVADGDRMGKFVASATQPAQHTHISSAVSDFADGAETIIRHFDGHLVYAGGEDIMAFLPMNDCVNAAKALASSFDEKISKVISDQKINLGDDKAPTLRVGIAIVHVLEPLGVSRQNADAAEKLAKGNAGTREQGNALGLRLFIRAGHEIDARMSFSKPEQFAQMEDWIKSYRNNYLTTRMAYDLRSVADRGCGTDCAAGFGDAYTENEIKLLLKRAREASIKASSSEADKHANAEAWKRLEDHIAQCKPHDIKAESTAFAKAMKELSSQLILARWLSARTQNDTGEK